jgi:hypothetical protein
VSINPSLILKGASVGYEEVFGEKDNEVFRFSYNNRGYFVDDQYCMNPKCKCNDAILTIFELHPQISRYSMKMGKCEITGMYLFASEVHCHHYIPLHLGGNDKFNNLRILHKEVQ